MKKSFAVLLSGILLAAGHTTLLAAQDFGSVDIGDSAVISVKMVFSSAAKLGRISVRTSGAENLDFINAGGGTCAIGAPYPKGAVCTVKVRFKPLSSGARYGAIVLTDSSSPQDVASTVYLQGFGHGPQMAFPPNSLTIGSGWSFPSGIAVDGSGNIFIVDGKVYKETLRPDGSYSRSTIGSGGSVALDGGGNLYLVDGSSIYEEVLQTNGSYIRARIATGFDQPDSLAIDGNGNLYVADEANVYKETLRNGSYTRSLVAGGFVSTSGVAIDGAGNVYVTDTDDASGTGAVYKETLSNGRYARSEIGSGWGSPEGVAVDGRGDVYIPDAGAMDPAGNIVGFGLLEEVPANGSYTETPLYDGPNYPDSVAVDGGGNVYFSVIAANGFLPGEVTAVYKLDIADPPALHFANAAYGSTSKDSPQVVTVSNIGTTALKFSDIIYPRDFPENSTPNYTGRCKTSQSVAVDGSCALIVDFSPVVPLDGEASILLKEKVRIKSDAAITGRSIAVSGTETKPTTAITLAPTSNPISAGVPLGLIAKVRAEDGVGMPTGTVVFYSGSAELGHAELRSGVAIVNTRPLAQGADTIVAKYLGDSNFFPSSSKAVTEYIAAGQDTLAFDDETAGAVGLGKASGAIPLTVTFDRAETLNGIQVLTQGAVGLDFTKAGGGTCAIGTAYHAQTACTVKIRFAPKHPGTRYGAVLLTANGGGVIGTGFLKGTGVGPQAISLLEPRTWSAVDLLTQSLWRSMGTTISMSPIRRTAREPGPYLRRPYRKGDIQRVRSEGASSIPMGLQSMAAEMYILPTQDRAISTRKLVRTTLMFKVSSVLDSQLLSAWPSMEEATYT